MQAFCSLRCSYYLLCLLEKYSNSSVSITYLTILSYKAYSTVEGEERARGYKQTQKLDNIGVFGMWFFCKKWRERST